MACFSTGIDCLIFCNLFVLPSHGPPSGTVAFLAALLNSDEHVDFPMSDGSTFGSGGVTPPATAQGDRSTAGAVLMEDCACGRSSCLAPVAPV